MTLPVLILEPAHGVVMLIAGLIAFEIVAIGFIFVGMARYKIFNSTYLQSNFGDEHRKATGIDTVPNGGYPDMGNGVYSKRLSYKDWLDLSKAQRIHYNFLEQVMPMLAFLLFGGLEFPIEASVFGGLFFIGRLLYCFYWSKMGSAHPMRVTGAIIGDLSLLGGFIVSLLSGIALLSN